MRLLDLHIHGAFGVDVLTAHEAELDHLSRGLWDRGVGAWLPTLVPRPLAELDATVARLSSYLRTRREGDGRGALPLGLHFEGPFVSPARSGALHRDLLLDGTGSGAGAFLEIAGSAPGRHMVTLAPEIPGAVALVREFVRRGFVVSLGHTEADAAALDEARRAGARHMTHFANAMKPLHHRELGPVGWGLLHDDVTVDVIADLVHLSREMLELVLKVKHPSRVALISDAVPPAGLPDGPYYVWGERLTVGGGSVRNPSGALAGSVSLLDQGVECLTRIGLSHETARQSASDVPRRILERG